MPLTETTLFTGFDRILNKVVIQDTTDYAAQGIDFNTDTVTGFLKFEYNIGSGWVATYNNLVGPTPDITPPSVLDYSTIDIPLDSDGKPLAAAYRITYLSHVVSAIDGEYDNTDEFNYSYDFTDPEVCLTNSVDCSSSKITSVDATDYAVDGVTTLSIFRAHTVYPPPASGLSPITANVVTLIYTPIAQGTSTSKIVSDVVYEQADGLNIVVQYTGSKEVVVACANKLSVIICCLAQMNTTYDYLESSNTAKAKIYLETKIVPTWRALVLFLAAQSAGNANKMAAAYAEVLLASGCDESCACTTDNSVVPVENVSGTGYTYVVDSPTGTIAVTQEVNGTVITFHLEVSDAILNIINNIANSVNVQGDGAYITVTPTGTNPKLFTVSYTGPVIHTNQLVQKQIKINPYDPLSLDPNYMIMEVTEIYNAGANVAAAPHTYQLGQNSPNGSADLALINVTGFLSNVLAKSFIVNASINKRWNAAGSALNATSNLRVDCFNTDLSSLTGVVQLRVIDGMNNVLTLSGLNSMLFNNDLYIALEIIIEP